MVIRFVNTLLSVNGPADSARIYLLIDDERQVSPTGPAVIDADGVRQELPPLVFKAVQHVIEAMRAGMAVKVSPLRHELPIDEAAHAIGMAKDDLRAYVAEGAIPFNGSIVQSTKLLNFNLNWMNIAGKPFDLALFMTNVTGEKYYIASSGGLINNGGESFILGEPRMYGMRLKYHF